MTALLIWYSNRHPFRVMAGFITAALVLAVLDAAPRRKQ